MNYSFAWCTGAGLLIRLTRWVSFQTIPVQYVDEYCQLELQQQLCCESRITAMAKGTLDERSIP